jgi:hypothetical protein
MRTLEILDLSRQLRRQAQERCDCVNKAHLFVHEVMFSAFADDPNLVATDALHGELSLRLAAKLDEGVAHV